LTYPVQLSKELERLAPARKLVDEVFLVAEKKSEVKAVNSREGKAFKAVLKNKKKSIELKRLWTFIL
jgi:hypothetical protein